MAEREPQDEHQLPRSFPDLLRTFREGTGRSRNNLAHEVGIDPSYLTRIESGDREPPKPTILDGIARALHLTPFADNRLRVSAGYTPKELTDIGWDPVFQAVLELKTDPHLSDIDRDEFDRVIMVLAARWRQL